MAYLSNPYYQSHAGSRISRLHGSDDPWALFGRGKEYPQSMISYKKSNDPDWSIPRYEEHDFASASSSIPWSQSSRNKAGFRYDPSAVNRTIQIADSSSIREFDPRYLHGTQPSVTSPGVLHYLQMGQSGPLYADKDQIGNQFPFVYIHSGTGEHRLIGGHHRATAALLKGEPLVARYTVGDY